jgi:hypothetical protein
VAGRLLIREPDTANPAQTHPFGLNEDGVALHEILRLILGNVDLYHEDSELLVKIRTNELRTNGFHRGKPERMVNILFDNEISLQEYARLLSSVGTRNSTFFAQVRSELALCLLAKKQGRFTEAFIYLYRILEYISIAFPMLYALSNHDFFGSQRFLKSLVLDGKEGDLKVLERAIPTLSAQGNLNGITFDFSVAGMHSDRVGAIRAELTEAVRPKVADMEFETEGDILFRVPFDQMSMLFVSVRNRMFHYKIGERNINLARVGGSELLCKICLKELLYWFSLVYTEIIRVLGRQVV